MDTDRFNDWKRRRAAAEVPDDFANRVMATVRREQTGAHRLLVGAVVILLVGTC